MSVCTTAALRSSDVEGAEASVLGEEFDYSAYIFLTLTVERPSAPMRQRLRAQSYVYVGDHGCYGDQLWVHQSFAAQAQRALGLAAPLDPRRDHEWNGTACIMKGKPGEHALHGLPRPVQLG